MSWKDDGLTPYVNNGFFLQFATQYDCTGRNEFHASHLLRLSVWMCRDALNNKYSSFSQTGFILGLKGGKITVESKVITFQGWVWEVWKYL